MSFNSIWTSSIALSMLAERKLHFDAIFHGVDSTLSQAIALTQKSSSAASREMWDRKSQVIVISLLERQCTQQDRANVVFQDARQWFAHSQSNTQAAFQDYILIYSSERKGAHVCEFLFKYSFKSMRKCIKIANF